MSIRPIEILNVSPSLPDELQCALEIAYNMRWCWNHDTTDLFRRLDRNLWEQVDMNPVKLLGRLGRDRIDQILRDDALLAHLDRVYKSLKDYMADKNIWYSPELAKCEGFLAAYFSLEFGLNETLPVYSGGLGMLAGDHLKAASDLGVPLVGMGLLYQEGYFRQYLNADGWQQEAYVDNDFYTMPVKPVIGEDGAQLSIMVEFPTGPVKALIWKIQVGRVDLYLLDTNSADNRPEDRIITSALYGGDLDLRIRQEILLGIGGVRALNAIGLSPTVYHMNEGHSAFLALERIRMYKSRENISFWEAHSLVRASNCFTTHTPVPAGNDVFPSKMVMEYFKAALPEYGITEKEFLGLGRQNMNNENEDFCMTVLAIKEAAFINGVSKLHGSVSRAMWKNIWPVLPLDEIPITHVTNGVHTNTWISKEMADLLHRYLGPRWEKDPADEELWNRVDLIPAEELWRTHERRRERLVAFARRRLEIQLAARGSSESEVRQASEVLNPEALTLGFARRFATYKRGTLLFRNLDRLLSILGNRERPVQIIFAGKAHPRDTAGKELIRDIIHNVRHPVLRRNIVFIENYDMFIARYLVQGVDVWLNTPRRPLEASGTSGMKVSANGGINASILDGWWCEAYELGNGWSIGRGEEYQNTEYQDDIEADALYDLLEKEIIPTFYNRGMDGLPRKWIEMMKSNMKTVCPQFNTSRMVKDYTVRGYIPGSRRQERMSKDNCEGAKQFALWKNRIRDLWRGVKIIGVKSSATKGVKVDDRITVEAEIELAGLTPEDVIVQIVYGSIDADGRIIAPEKVAMTCNGGGEGGKRIFKGEMVCHTSGRYGHTVRVLPRHEMLTDPFKMGLIAWGGDQSV